MPSKNQRTAQQRSRKANATTQHRKRTKSPLQPRRKWKEAELLKGVTPGLIGGEIDWVAARTGDVISRSFIGEEASDF